jgi:hypothetical protein
MDWKCSENHEWSTAYGNVRADKWCPKCAGTLKLTLKDCQDSAIFKGGVCLSTEYVNIKLNMDWKCSENHEWTTAYGNVRADKWCPKCGGTLKLTLKDCQDLAISKGGLCLSTEYVNNRLRMNWKCSENHEWSTCMSKIKHKTWCPKCAVKRTADGQRLTLKDCQDLAISKGGVCLSTEYVNNNTKMLWKCSENHEWSTTRGSIHYGCWCPNCSGSKSEEACREILKRHSGVKFPNTRPKFMEGLELDGYNKKLNIAFGYNGIQHYEYNLFFHRNNPDNLELQKARDRRKYELCRDNKINLIIIPYQYSYKNPEELEDFILSELLKFQ